MSGPFQACDLRMSLCALAAVAPTAPFGKAAATVESGHVDGGASALLFLDWRDEGEGLFQGAAEPLPDEASSALYHPDLIALIEPASAKTEAMAG